MLAILPEEEVALWYYRLSQDVKIQAMRKMPSDLPCAAAVAARGSAPRYARQPAGAHVGWICLGCVRTRIPPGSSFRGCASHRAMLKLQHKPKGMKLLSNVPSCTRNGKLFLIAGQAVV